MFKNNVNAYKQQYSPCQRVWRMVKSTQSGEKQQNRVSGRMLTPAQCRAARALLAWTQQQLADQAGVGVQTIRLLEGGRTIPRRSTLQVIQRAFEQAGVDLIGPGDGGPGVRFRDR
jgi:DNA-binding XRE family transcriptional regulator